VGGVAATKDLKRAVTTAIVAEYEASRVNSTVLIMVFVVVVVTVDTAKAAAVIAAVLGTIEKPMIRFILLSK
jgi:hypothetical protein